MSASTLRRKVCSWKGKNNTYTFSTQRWKVVRRTRSALPSAGPSLNGIRLARSGSVRNCRYDQCDKRCNCGGRHGYRICPFDHLTLILFVSRLLILTSGEGYLATTFVPSDDQADRDDVECQNDRGAGDDSNQTMSVEVCVPDR